jgi:hypothetical protein
VSSAPPIHGRHQSIVYREPRSGDTLTVFANGDWVHEFGDGREPVQGHRLTGLKLHLLGQAVFGSGGREPSTQLEAGDDCHWITYRGRRICITDGHGRHERVSLVDTARDTDHQWGFTATEAERKDFANQLAAIYGMRRDSILIEPGDGPAFRVGDTPFMEGGHYTPMTRTITLWADDHSPAAIGEMVPHEVMHYKFDLFMEQVKKENAAFKQDSETLRPGETLGHGHVTPRQRELLVDPVGSDRLTAEGARLYPALAVLRDFQDEMAADKNRAGIASYAMGMSDYAAAYWKAFLAGKTQTDRALNETLAELHRYTANKPDGQIPHPYLGYGKEARAEGQPQGREVWQRFYTGVLANAKKPV